MILLSLLLAAIGIAPRPAGAIASEPGPATPSRFFPPLAHAPLDPPLTITGGFGEYRVGHFHAGVDLGTGGRVGKPVYAPLAGHVERIRASGVGYGRSIYIRSRDGRLLQLGHLDAFAEPLAAWVAARQESSGQYEQDLWPEATRFPVKAGQRVAWSGESGAGGPHVHFEIRRGDMAMNPLRAGLAVKDTRAPTLASLTLEPLDDSSFVMRGAAPRTFALGARAETVLVQGRVRVVVGARDGTWRGVDRMVPWSVAMEWKGRRVECRFDSISWATDMPEGDYVYDTGRIVGEKGIVLWAPAGFRPHVFVADAPLDQDAGTITVRPGDPPRMLTLTARDLGGGVTRRRIVLRASNAAANVPRPRGWTVSEIAALGGRPDQARMLRFDPASRRDAALGLFRWSVPDGCLFEPAMFFAESLGVTGGTRELVPIGRAWALHPFATPLRKAIRLRIDLPPMEATMHVGLYRDQGGGWDLVGAALDSASHAVVAESRSLGRFALFADTLGPRIAPLKPPAHATPATYNRWALEARLTEDGSGVDARATWFEVDGARMPSEWDAEQGTLRWRPRRAPATGAHRFNVVAHDRAGNVSLRGGTFVLD